MVNGQKPNLTWFIIIGLGLGLYEWDYDMATEHMHLGKS